MSVDPFALRQVVTRQFYEQHVVQIKSVHDAVLIFDTQSRREMKDIEEYVEKATNEMYQSRPNRVAVNTVLVFGRVDADRLKHNITGNQTAYRQRDADFLALEAADARLPVARRTNAIDSVYITRHRYVYFQREGKKKAEYMGSAYLRFSVDDKHGQDHHPSEGNPGFFKICHLERMTDDQEGGELDDRFGLQIYPPHNIPANQIHWNAGLRFWVHV